MGGLKDTVSVTGRVLLASQSPGALIVPLTCGQDSQLIVRLLVIFASAGAPRAQIAVTLTGSPQ
jgi:hypothetical protein